MRAALTQALTRKANFLAVEQTILKGAWIFYQQGFTSTRLSPAQMSGVTECLEMASSFEDARCRISKFLLGQMRKLNEKKENQEKGGSWLTPAGEEAISLGALLISNITEEKYFLGSREHPLDGADRLAALRRFWACVQAFYRYRQTFRSEMPLEEVR